MYTLKTYQEQFPSPFFILKEIFSYFFKKAQEEKKSGEESWLIYISNGSSDEGV